MAKHRRASAHRPNAESTVSHHEDRQREEEAAWAQARNTVERRYRDTHEELGAAYDPAADQITPPPRVEGYRLDEQQQPLAEPFQSFGHNGHDGFQGHGSAPTSYAHAHPQAFAAPQQHHAAAATWGAHSPQPGQPQQGHWAPAMAADYASAPPSIRSRSAAGPVFLTAILLLGAGAGGYYKLDLDMKDMKANMAAKDALLTKMDEAKGRESEARAHAEQELKVQAAAYEEKLKALGQERDKALLAQPAVAPAAPVAAQKEEPAPEPKAAKADHKISKKHEEPRLVARSVKSEHQTEKTDNSRHSVLPRLPAKHKVSDDPLAGLGQ